jgi:hypothetical protein
MAIKINSDTVIQYGVSPPAGVHYVNSDQKYLVVERINKDKKIGLR